MKETLVIGSKFGRLTVTDIGIKRYGSREYPACFCECECGKSKTVLISNLKSGITRSCGCIQKEVTVKRNTIHGMATRKGRHPIYGVWKGMFNRCYNIKDKSYKDYGGRGILVCGWWHDFRHFCNDMLPLWKSGLTIERVDNDKGYSKDNCVWADRKTQNRNKRNIHLLTLNGETLPISSWAERLHPENLDFIYVRLKRGWTPEQALTIPIGENRPQYRGRWPVKSS